NKDAMKEIGMTDETGEGRAPVTWEEMRLACQRLTKDIDGEIVRYGYGIRPFIEAYTSFLFRAGGHYLDSDARRVRFDDETGLETLRFLYDLVYKDKTAYIEPDYLSTTFGSGKIAMYVSSTASLPYNEQSVAGKFKWDTAPIPYPEGKKNISRTLFQGTNVGIFRNHSKEKLQAAWRFLRFLTNTENSTTWAIGTGYLPVRYSVLKTEKTQKYLVDNPTFKTPVSLLDNARFEPNILIWEPMRNVITDHIEAALNGRRNPEETIISMKAECEKIIRTF
ncbi:extracellular solute-binding protein, partial [Candidatus Sumerlaeota bacterium]|nr:extracellular solute-binding protein [Candidatus Sumerlaeota bacterium]